MVQVYDSTQIQCSCVLEDPDWGLLALDVSRISKVGGVLNSPLLFPRESRHEMVLKFTGGHTALQTAQVVSSGEDGLHVRWRHASLEVADEFEKLLARMAVGVSPARPKDRASPHVLTNDGKIDINATLLSRAQKVRGDDLAARNRTLRVIKMSMINQLIQEAVSQAFDKLGRTLDESERGKLLKESEEIFNERLKELEAQKADLQTRSTSLQAQLDRARSLLDEERGKVVRADQFTVSDSGLLELEKRLGRIVDRAMRGGHVPAELELEMRAIMARLLDEEREKISDLARQAHNDAIDLLERKVDRLARSLEQTQDERDHAREHAALLEANGGVGLRNIMKAGLSTKDAERELKLSLLKSLVDDNRELRDELQKRAAHSSSSAAGNGAGIGGSIGASNGDGARAQRFSAHGPVERRLTSP